MSKLQVLQRTFIVEQWLYIKGLIEYYAGCQIKWTESQILDIHMLLERSMLCSWLLHHSANK